jgi:TonB-dependent starch-binding outer membrane protein SusC
MRNFYSLFSSVFLLVLLLIATQGRAQSTKLTGKVFSGDDGTALPGVSILEKGTTNGTVTDSEGSYTINVSPTGTLVFSFVGYTSQEVAIQGRTAIDVTLEGDITALSEVVVVGYGQQEKKDVTGVVTAVDEKLFNRGAIVSPDQLIAGKIAGVQITQNSGEPGGQSSIRIRGGTSINAGNEPLYVIDGVPIDNTAFNPGGLSGGRNPLNFINPNDIETFTVLKDASAAAIYGSRAANGVIVITTKRGKAGTSSITYDGWVSIGQIADRLDVFSADQFREIITAKAPQHIDLLGDANTDWQDQIYQTAIGHSHSVLFSGGKDDFNYRASVGYQDQDGIIKTSNTKRTSLSFSMGQKFFDGDLSITVNLKASRTNDIFSQGVVGAALEMAPTQPVYDKGNPYGGYYVWKKGSNYESQATTNPLATLNLVSEKGVTNRSIGNIQFDYKIRQLPGLSANLNLGYDLGTGVRKKFQPSIYFPISSRGGEARIENYEKFSKLLESYLNYKKEFESINSTFDITAGYSWQDWNSEYPSLTATNLTGDGFGTNQPGVGKTVTVNNSVIENRLISFFGRLNYGFKDKYLLTASIRRDGSTRFGPLNRWGVFPSAAFAWRIYDEPFMSSLQNTFSDLKLRVGYGVNGNQEIPDYRYIPTYTPSTLTAQYQLGDAFYSTYRPDGYDDGLKWEETSSLNIGLDYGLFGGRISGSIEYYKKNTKDLLFERTLGGGANLTNIILTNVGEIENQGVEFTVEGTAVNSGDLKWTLSYNIAFNKNEIKALDGSDDPGFAGYQTGTISGGVGNYVQIQKVGQPAWSYFVFKHKMIDGKPAADNIDYNEDGKIDNTDIYEDLTGDGVVTDVDRRPFKQRAPKVLMGLTSNVVYKKFDLGFTLRSNLGGYVYNNVASNGANLIRANDNFVPRNMLTSVLKTNFTRAQYFSDYYVEKASFLRMDNITLGYTNHELVNKMKLRLYATVQNPFLITDYSGLDPEVFDGIDNNLYPRSRTFIFGVNVGF